MSPGRAFPKVTDIRFARMVKVITPGIDYGLNQLLAKMEGEFRMKTLPMEARIDPAKHHPGCPSSSKVLSQTPAMRKTPPTEQPIFIPNLSSTQFAGKAQKGWKIGKKRVKSVMIIGLYP